NFVEGVGQPPAAPLSSLVPSSRPGFPLSTGLLILWGAGGLTCFIIWALRWRRVVQTVRRAGEVTTGKEFETLRRIEASAGTLKPIELRLSGGSLEPGVFGILR